MATCIEDTPKQNKQQKTIAVRLSEGGKTRTDDPQPVGRRGNDTWNLSEGSIRRIHKRLKKEERLGNWDGWGWVTCYVCLVVLGGKMAGWILWTHAGK